MSRKVSFSSALELLGKSLSLIFQASCEASGCIKTPASTIPKIKNMLITTTLVVDTAMICFLVHATEIIEALFKIKQILFLAKFICK